MNNKRLQWYKLKRIEADLVVAVMIWIVLTKVSDLREATQIKTKSQTRKLSITNRHCNFRLQQIKIKNYPYSNERVFQNIYKNNQWWVVTISN